MSAQLSARMNAEVGTCPIIIDAPTKTRRAGGSLLWSVLPRQLRPAPQCILVTLVIIARSSSTTFVTIAIIIIIINITIIRENLKQQAARTNNNTA